MSIEYFARQFFSTFLSATGSKKLAGKNPAADSTTFSLRDASDVARASSRRIGDSLSCDIRPKHFSARNTLADGNRKPPPRHEHHSCILVSQSKQGQFQLYESTGRGVGGDITSGPAAPSPLISLDSCEGSFDPGGSTSGCGEPDSAGAGVCPDLGPIGRGLSPGTESAMQVMLQCCSQ